MTTDILVCSEMLHHMHEFEQLVSNDDGNTIEQAVSNFFISDKHNETQNKKNEFANQRN